MVARGRARIEGTSRGEKKETVGRGGEGKEGGGCQRMRGGEGGRRIDVVVEGTKRAAAEEEAKTRKKEKRREDVGQGSCNAREKREREETGGRAKGVRRCMKGWKCR